MSNDWVKDIGALHTKFGVNDWVSGKLETDDVSTLREFLKFRISFLKEELQETETAVESYNPEEIVDGLIDLCVVAIGTLNAFNVDAYQAWNAIHTANMTKEPGVKPSRPNKFGLPDLIKPHDWVGPSHEKNHGILDKLQ
jgi:hypothetical protein